MDIKHKKLSIVLLFFGLFFIIITLIKETFRCNKQKVIYKYIPRTFKEEQSSPIMVSDIFKKMFSLPSPWINSISAYDDREQEKINRYFISQS